MPTTFTAFTSSNRPPNTAYYTPEVVVPDNGDRMVRFSISPADFLVDEPDTTVVYWEIQIADAPGGEFRHSTSGTWTGLNGVIPPKPVGRQAMSMPAAGSVIRGMMYFTTANDARKRFGVEGETY